jgi:exodeoxyribonuclease-3
VAAKAIKIATYNVNGIRSRLPHLLAWLKRDKPDIACLQELKAVHEGFPLADIHSAGYGALWKGQRSWNGVAVLARGVDPVESRNVLPGDMKDTHARYLEAMAHGVLVGCLYLPNGNPQPGPKFDYKLRWFERLIRHARKLVALPHPVVLAGDFNVVPTDFDIYDPKSWRKDALLQPESRDAWQRLLAQGWLDAVRSVHPDERIYTFWDYMRNRWPRDAGLRLDHILLSPDLAARLKASGVDRAVRGKPNASDHAPVWVELGAPKKSRQSTSAASTRTKASKTKSAGAAARRPLLVIDGDSFAHRAYHALPKNILRNDGKPAGSILGFANMLLRLYQAERPASGPRGMGHARRPDLSAPKISRVSERARIRRCHRRTTGCAAGFRAGLRLQDREARRVRG